MNESQSKPWQFAQRLKVVNGNNINSCSVTSRCGSQTTPCHHSHKVNELASNTESVEQEALTLNLTMMFDSHLRRLPGGMWLSWASVKEHELRHLPAGIRPRLSHHHQLPGGERREEESLDSLPWKDEKGPSSVRPKLDLFQRQRWGHF